MSTMIAERLCAWLISTLRDLNTPWSQHTWTGRMVYLKYAIPSECGNIHRPSMFHTRSSLPQVGSIVVQIRFEGLFNVWVNMMVYLNYTIPKTRLPSWNLRLRYEMVDRHIGNSGRTICRARCSWHALVVGFRRKMSEIMESIDTRCPLGLNVVSNGLNNTLDIRNVRIMSTVGIILKHCRFITKTGRNPRSTRRHAISSDVNKNSAGRSLEDRSIFAKPVCAMNIARSRYFEWIIYGTIYWSDTAFVPSFRVRILVNMPLRSYNLIRMNDV